MLELVIQKNEKKGIRPSKSKLNQLYHIEKKSLREI